METIAPSSVKDRILAVACDLFHRQGYNSTGINQIIFEARVAKASLYQHFKSKDDLCEAYLREKSQRWFDDFYRFAEKKSDKALATFDYQMVLNGKENFRGCPFINMASEISPEKKALFKIIQDHKLRLQTVFNGSVDNPELAYHIYALFECATIESQLFQSQEPIMRTKRLVSSMVF